MIGGYHDSPTKEFHISVSSNTNVVTLPTLPCRSNSKDITELHDYCLSIVERVNHKYGTGPYQPIVWVERPVSLYEKIALYSIADVAVVTATRDGMNLVPYEYIVCRQGAPVCHSSQSRAQ